MSELHNRFDQPRTIHRKYCDDLKNLAENTNTRAGMIRYANSLTDILNGFIRLKAEDCRKFITTMAEPSLSKYLREGWNLHTESRKDIPPVEELIDYVKMKSAQAPEEVTPPPVKHSTEKHKAKPTQPKYRGNTHTAASPAVSTPSPSLSVKGRGNPNHQKSAYPQYRYVCPLCADNHYAWFCTLFEQLSVAKRREHVKQHNLCNNCLKPGHLAADCRSVYKCKSCQGPHNTLLHEKRSQAAAPPAQVSTNATRNYSTPHLKDNLMMTSQVLLTGPTGMTLIARALLDSASSLSIVSTEATKLLALRRQDSSVSISHK